MSGWSSDPTSIFDENMVLGENNTLFATDGHSPLSFDVPAGTVNWILHFQPGTVQLQYATSGGGVGVLVANAGRLGYVDSVTSWVMLLFKWRAVTRLVAKRKPEVDPW
jgi:hypothetical protein